MTRPASIFLATLAAATTIGLAHADDWPHWRGPNRDNVSAETNWLSSPAADPLWSTNVGMGHSSVAIVGDRLFAFGFDMALSQDIVRCLDAKTGAPYWTYGYAAKLDAISHSGGTHTTPTVDGERVYVANRVGVLRCLDANTGILHWERDLADIFGTKPTGYGFGGAPLVTGDLVVCNVSKTVALNKLTGKPAWETRDHLAMYSSPTTFDLGGRACVAAFTREGLFVLDRDSGAELHHFPWRNKGSTTVNASTPVVVDDKLFISSGYGLGAALVQFTDRGATAVWESRVMRTKLSGCVRIGDRIFGFDERVLKCIDLEGNEVWRKRGLGMGALTAAGDRLIVLAEKGDLVIASATSDRFQQLSRTKALTNGVCWSNPVLAGGLIYCRNSIGDLVCLDARGE